MLKAAVVALLALPSILVAQQQQQSIEPMSIGPRLVFYRPTDAEHGRWSPGLQFRMPIAVKTMLEISADRVRYRANGANVTVTPIQATLIGYFDSDTALVPYLLIGGGWYSPRADGPYVNPHRRFGPHVGGGVEFRLSRRFSVDGSYRFLWTQVHRLSQPGRWLGSDFKRRGHMLTAALNYRL